MYWALVLVMLLAFSECTSIKAPQANNADNYIFTFGGMNSRDGINWNREFQTINSSPSTCSCWISNNRQVECKCQGLQVNRIPNDFDSTVQSITLFNCAIDRLRKNELQQYKISLVDLVIDKASLLTSIEEGVFNGFHQLQRIFIRRAELLTSLPVNVFQVYLPKLRALTLTQTGLREFPVLRELNTGDTIVHQIDLNDNKIDYIPMNSVRLRTDEFLLSYNPIRYIEAGAFNGSQIAKLCLRGNHQLTNISMDAFMGLESLRQLYVNNRDLSETAITDLPTRGLSDLEILRLVNTQSLKEIPSVYHYKSLLEAYLTYPYHCCAFEFPATHDPNLHAQHTRMIAEMQEKYCNRTSDQTDEAKLNRSEGIEAIGDLYYFGLDLSLQSSLYGDEGEWGDIAGVFHQTAVNTDENNTFHAYCGQLTMIHRQVKCSPQPDAFNPCEDIMGTSWLRIAAWIVASASVVGNLAVIIVLSSSRAPMVVSKFLMVNLAIADLFMGIYLFFIAGMDLISSGAYFNFANDWQNGMGCKIAGFLTVFSTELSVYTLVVITSERWHTITYAVNLHRRMRMSSTVKIIVVGWMGAMIMAALPLTGVSNFSKTSICLPLGVQSAGDLVYILLLLLGNALGFISICFFYGHMYHSISDRHNSLASHSDAKVAKKMALLVFTNLACLAPITFFGLTAVIGYPLIDVTHSKILLVFIYPLNACTNPYLYALLTKQYRRDLYSVLNRHSICRERAARLLSSTRTRRNRAVSVRANAQFQSVLYRQPTSIKTKASKKSYSDVIVKMSKNSPNQSGVIQQQDVNDSRKELEMLPSPDHPLDMVTKDATLTIKRPTSLSVGVDGETKTSQPLTITTEAVATVNESNGGTNSEDNVSFLAHTRTISPSGMRRSAVGSPHPVKQCQVYHRHREMVILSVNQISPTN